jgi:hypothetical protein
MAKIKQSYLIVVICVIAALWIAAIFIMPARWRSATGEIPLTVFWLSLLNPFFRTVVWKRLKLLWQILLIAIVLYLPFNSVYALVWTAIYTSDDNRLKWINTDISLVFMYIYVACSIAAGFLVLWERRIKLMEGQPC